MSFQGVSNLSGLREYLVNPENRSGCFADTSILFAVTYHLDAFSDEAVAAFDVLSEFGAAAYTNVTVRAEYLENHRRVIIGEALIDLLEDLGAGLSGPLHEKLKAHRTSYRRKVTEERSAKMDVGQIKMFRTLLSERKSANGDGWSLFCRNYLHDRLKPLWQAVEDKLRVNFISFSSKKSSEMMNSQPDWDAVIGLMGRYGVSSADAMIINMFLSSKIPALLTADQEMAQCVVIESGGAKRVFVPDSIA